MSLSGQTLQNIVLRPQENTSVQWNLGKCVVDKHLGNSILIGEPAKKDNKIVTIPHSKKILARDNHDNEVVLNYANQKTSKKNVSLYLCRAQVDEIIFPNDSLEILLPDELSKSEIVIIAPRRDWCASMYIVFKL